MKWGTGVTVLTALAVVPLAGCENWSSVYRETSLDNGTTLITDAKQRVVVNTSDYREAREGTNHRIICAEPSPDVAQAFQAALQAGAAVTNGQTKVDANLALATASQIAQLGERLASIQLLRDKMYRACEAYANGATTQGGYISMLARVDKTMTAMLGMEMAAGAFGRSLATAGGSSSVTGADPAKVKAAQDALKTATDNFVKARDAYNSESDATKKAALADQLRDAATKLNDAASQLAAMDIASALSAGGAAGSAPGVIAGKQGPDATTAGVIAAIHRNFIDDDGIDGLVDACVTELSQSRYAYDDFLILAKKYSFYPTTEQRDTAGENKPGKPRPVSLSTEEYQRHFQNFMEQRLQFTKFCMASVLGGGNGQPSTFIKDRQMAKERLRLMSEYTAMMQQCSPVLQAGRGKDPSGGAQYDFCRAALQSATSALRASK